MNDIDKDLAKIGELANMVQDLRQQNENLAEAIEGTMSSDNTIHILITVSSIILNIVLGVYIFLMPI